MTDSKEKHDLVALVVQLAQQLGRTPKKTEFLELDGVTAYRLEHSFGNFAVLLQAAGLESYQERRKKALPAAIFERDIKDHLEAYRPQAKVKLPLPRAAIISDIHWPFANQKVLERFYRHVEKEQPDFVIIDGDAWDMYSWSRYPRSHNIFVPEEEERLARKMNELFWQEVQRLAPKAKCVQLLGNHDVRPLRRTMESQPTIEHWVQKIFGALFTFPGVQTIFDPREEFFLSENTIVHHGYLGKLGDHRDHTLFNTIVGHTHKGGVVFREIRGSTLWELNCGHAGDPLSKGLTYTPQRITGWTPGFGSVDEDGPRFIWV